MRTVALTGNAASGKSMVAGVWRDAGVPVVDADALAREAVEPGSPGLEAVREAFGDAVVTADGELDRACVREIVFHDDRARARLEAIVHPRIAELRDRWMEARRLEGHPLAAAEIPLLFETGTEGDYDVVVFVDSPEAERLRRLVELRGLAEDEARRIMAAQMDPARKRARADHRLVNDADPETLRARALALLDTLRGTSDEGGHPAPDRMRVDLHLHTLGSFDCLSDPLSVLERARERGVERIAITDHDGVEVALRMAERFPERVIPGEEVKTAEGIDVIGLYLREVIPRGTPALETCERIREQGGIAYLPHPYARGKGGGGRMADELAARVEVVEVFNARLHPGSLNEPAEGLARRHDRLRGAGSDAHTLGEVAGAWVDVPRHENSADGLRAALARGRPQGRTASNLVHLASTWAKVRRHFFGAPEFRLDRR